LRLRVPNTGSMVELSSKFGCDPGEAVDLILAAFDMGLVAEGISFHVGSQCTNFENFVQALEISAAILREAKSRRRYRAAHRASRSCRTRHRSRLLPKTDWRRC